MNGISRTHHDQPCEQRQFVRTIVCFLALTTTLATAAPEAKAQAGLREALERLDINENGVIEVEEITPLARPYLERVLGTDRRSIDKPRSISRILEYARIHYAIRNGVSGKDVQPKPENKVKSFKPDPDQPIVPGFGLGRIKYRYLQQDLDEADETIGRYDYNRDGLISRSEALRSRWTHRNPFDDDINKDDQLSRMELTQRYARRRMLQEDIGELARRSRRVGNDLEASRKRRTDDSQWWRKGGSNFWLTASLMGRFDANRNGRLELSETESLGIPAAKLDTDGDGEISRDEMFAIVKLMQDDAGDMTLGLPCWFYEMDKNRDDQVALHEFAAVSRRLDEFELLDQNEDGFLTVAEASKAEAIVGGQYRNETAEVLPPQRTIISEIEVEDDYLIGDVDVQISITHSHVGYLDAFLTNPDGQRIELFTEVGGGGDHFENTIFDDQAPVQITRAKPPFRGRFRPKGPEKKQPGLQAFNDKSVKGVWQLVVRGTRNDRFGMLHKWSLRVTPKDDVPLRTKQDDESVESNEQGQPGRDGMNGTVEPSKRSDISIFDRFEEFTRSEASDSSGRESTREAKKAEAALRKAERRDELMKRRRKNKEAKSGDADEPGSRTDETGEAKRLGKKKYGISKKKDRARKTESDAGAG